MVIVLVLVLVLAVVVITLEFILKEEALPVACFLLFCGLLVY